MATLNLTNTPYKRMLEGFAKDLLRIPVVKKTHPLTGEEVFADGSGIPIRGPLFRQEDSYTQEAPAIIKDADAVLMVRDDVVLNRDDKIVYDDELYRVHEVEVRRLGDQVFYKLGRLYKFG